MPAAFSRWCGRASCLIFFTGLVQAEMALSSQTLTAIPLPAITNLFQVRQLGLQNPGISHPIRLEGQVCWVSPRQKTFAMLDASGGLILEMEWLNQPLSIGQRVRLTGTASVLKAGNVFRIGVDGLVVDDDGQHPMTESTGAVFLKAGRIPIRVEWFNGLGPFGLEVSCEGPDLPRRRISNSELFRGPGESTNRVSGLDYRCFEGWWTELPDFSRLKPVKTGAADNFDLGVRTRDEAVGLQFSGLFAVPRDGIYKFSLNSDDGSRLSVGEPNVQVEIIGQGQLPAPRPMFIGQLLDEAEDGSWSQIEGKVIKVWPAEERLRMELSVGLAHMECGSHRYRGFVQSRVDEQSCPGDRILPGGLQLRRTKSAQPSVGARSPAD